MDYLLGNAPPESPELVSGWEVFAKLRTQAKSALHARGLGLRHVAICARMAENAKITTSDSHSRLVLEVCCLPSPGSVAACELQAAADAMCAVSRSTSDQLTVLRTAALLRASAAKISAVDPRIFEFSILRSNIDDATASEVPATFSPMIEHPQVLEAWSKCHMLCITRSAPKVATAEIDVLPSQHDGIAATTRLDLNVVGLSELYVEQQFGRHSEAINGEDCNALRYCGTHSRVKNHSVSGSLQGTMPAQSSAQDESEIEIANCSATLATREFGREVRRGKRSTKLSGRSKAIASLAHPFYNTGVPEMRNVLIDTIIRYTTARVLDATTRGVHVLEALLLGAIADQETGSKLHSWPGTRHKSVSRAELDSMTSIDRIWETMQQGLPDLSRYLHDDTVSAVMTAARKSHQARGRLVPWTDASTTAVAASAHDSETAM